MMNAQLHDSRLVVLPSGQIVGHPMTRRALKRELRQARLQRQAAYREQKRNGQQ